MFFYIWAPASYSMGPVGTIIPFGGTDAPEGYLLCNGQAVDRVTYTALFAVIGTTYGVGDGVNTFNVPDLRGRVPVGFIGDTAGRITITATQEHANPAMGIVGGNETHQLSVNEMPAHSHNYTASPTNARSHYNDTNHWASQQQVPAITSSVGNNAPHNNMPPFQFCNFIIKTTEDVHFDEIIAQQKEYFEGVIERQNLFFKAAVDQQRIQMNQQHLMFTRQLGEQSNKINQLTSALRNMK